MTEALGGKLHVSSPDSADCAFLIEQPVVRIGRAPAPVNDLVLEHGWVSREHARIYCDRLPYRIQDMRSSNGTSVNDVPIPPDEIRPLRDGDVIAIGQFRLRLETPAETPEEAPMADTAERIRGLRVRVASRRLPPAPPGELPPDTEVGPLLPRRWVGMPERASRWLQYLPPIYGEDEFLGRFLLVLEDLLGPVEQLVGHFDLFLDPRTAPAAFLPWLNDWLAEIVDERLSTETQRELLAEASWLYQARGTRAGLRRYLEICTGCQSEITENGDGPHSFRVVVHAEGAPVDHRMVERIIDVNRPAHTSYTVEID